MVTSLCRSLKRFADLRRLDGRLHEHRTPLSVCHHTPANTVRLIASNDTDSFVRRLAAQVCHLHSPTTELLLANGGHICYVWEPVSFCMLLDFCPWMSNGHCGGDPRPLSPACGTLRQNQAFNKVLGMPTLCQGDCRST